jgi:O-antigen ligase
MNFIKKTGIVVIFALSFFYLAPASYHERITTIGESEDYNQTDNFGRINIWKRSLEMIAKNPVFGVGPGCFAIASGFTYAQEVGGAAWNMTTHNSFLLIAVEMGVFGGYLYLAFLVRSLMAMRRVLRETNQPEMDEYVWLARALEAAFVGFLVSGFFLSFCYKPVSYFFVGLVIAYRFRLAVLLKGDDMDGAVVHP